MKNNGGIIMARISYTSYSNSSLATITDIMGSVYNYMGGVSAVIMLFSNDEGLGWGEKILVAVLMLATFVGIGMFHKKLAARISNRKKHKEVIKKIKSNGFEKKISESAEFAAYVYNKFPDKMIKKYVIRLNPMSKCLIGQKQS